MVLPNIRNCINITKYGYRYIYIYEIFKDLKNFHLVVKLEIKGFWLTCNTCLLFMFGCEINYSKRRYQQAIDDCKYSAQHFNTVAICAFTKGKIICPKLFPKCFTLKHLIAILIRHFGLYMNIYFRLFYPRTWKNGGHNNLDEWHKSKNKSTLKIALLQ